MLSNQQIRGSVHGLCLVPEHPHARALCWFHTTGMGAGGCRALHQRGPHRDARRPPAYHVGRPVFSADPGSCPHQVTDELRKSDPAWSVRPPLLFPRPLQALARGPLARALGAYAAKGDTPINFAKEWLRGAYDLAGPDHLYHNWPYAKHAIFPGVLNDSKAWAAPQSTRLGNSRQWRSRMPVYVQQ